MTRPQGSRLARERRNRGSDESSIAGHSDIGVTMKVYAHASLDEQRKALVALGQRLG
ncbi:hypothetical protein [Streptacidiphilus sp. MAP12-33]|uniref:hypothetical protein n=1 Tax=Streptacidiphilus sp. MAP12-33 TaxID=3156266 RepID=UPI00351992F2